MQTKYIAVGIGLILAAGFVLGVPAHKSRIRSDIVDWVEVENLRQDRTTLGFETIDVDLWSATIAFQNVTLSGPFSMMAAERLTLKIDSPFLLFPHERVTNAVLDTVEFTDPTTLTELTFKTITVENLSGYTEKEDLTTRPALEILNTLTVDAILAEEGHITELGALPDTPYGIDIGTLAYLNIVEGRVGRMLVTDLTSISQNGRITIPSAELTDFGFAGLFLALGRSEIDTTSSGLLSQYRDVGLSRLRMKNLSLYTTKGTGAFIQSLDVSRSSNDRFEIRASDLALTALTGDISLADMKLLDFDLDGLMMHIMEAGGGAPDPKKLIGVMEGGSVFLEKFDAKNIDGSSLAFDTLQLTEFSQVNGIPTGLKLSILNAQQTSPPVQTPPPEAIPEGPSENTPEDQPTPSEVDAPTLSFGLPDTIGGDGILHYHADLDADFVEIDLQAFDRSSGLDIRISVSLQTVLPLFNALSSGTQLTPPDVLGVAVSALQISLDTKTSWPIPTETEKPLSARQVMMSFVQNTVVPPSLEDAISAPLIGFLSQGGKLDIAFSPRTPLSVFQIKDLGELPPNILLDVTGVKIDHQIYAAQ